MRGAVLVGGMAGTALRLAVAAVVPVDGGWPWGTLIVNVGGAGLLGALVVRLPPGPTRSAFGTGLLGAFTTFSAFAVEATTLGRDGRAGLAAAYVLVSIAAGLLAAGAGARLARAAT